MNYNTNFELQINDPIAFKEEQGKKQMKKVFISFRDEKNIVVDGYFELIEQTDSYVKIKSNDNIITIPYHKINKIKEKIVKGV
jgi:sporulation protein YlmC with PRC-barrel domain